MSIDESLKVRWTMARLKGFTELVLPLQGNLSLYIEENVVAQ